MLCMRHVCHKQEDQAASLLQQKSVLCNGTHHRALRHPRRPLSGIQTVAIHMDFRLST